MMSFFSAQLFVNKLKELIMLLSEGFKSQLTAKEQKAIEDKVPMHQARITMAFRCNLTVDKKTQNNCSCALSEHMITILPKPPIGKTERVYHLFDIIELETLNDNTVTFKTAESEVVVTTTVCLKFVRRLMRNRYLACPLGRDDLQFTVNLHDPSKFPPFEIPLSVAQMFQFQYNATCALYECSYIHEVATYYHELAKMHDGIFDINSLPPSLVGEELDHGVYMTALFSTLGDSPHVRGINCEGILIEDVLSEVASVVGKSPYLNMVRIVNTGGITMEGMQALAGAISESEEMNVVYWDLSQNELVMPQLLFKALARSHTKMATLRFENCKIEEEDMEALFSSIRKHRGMRQLKELAIAGNRLTTQLCHMFKNVMELFGAKSDTLERLSVGPAQVSELVTTAIDAAKQPLKHLKIVDTNLTHNSVYDLNRHISLSQSLKFLGFDGCNINDLDFESILVAVMKNDKIPTIALSLNHTRMKKEAWIASLLKVVKGGLGKKLVRLSIDQNGIGRAELAEILKAKAAFVSLTELSIAQNFADRPDTGKMLRQLLEIKSLRGLNVSGRGSSGLRAEAIPLLMGVAKSPSIMQLDVSGNGIGDAVLTEAMEIVKQSKTIRRIMLDSNGITRLDLVRSYFEVCGDSKTLMVVDPPRNDMLALLKNDASLQQSLAYMYYRASTNVGKNRARLGIPNSLYLTDDDVLRRIIDEEIVLIQDYNRQEKLKIFEHSSIAAAVGLPLPFETGTSVAAALKDLDSADDTNLYVSPLLLVPITEKPDMNPCKQVHAAINKRSPDLINNIQFVPMPQEEEDEGEEQDEPKKQGPADEEQEETFEF